MVLKVVEKLARQDVFTHLPTKENIQNNCQVDIQVDVAGLRTAEEKDFDDLVQDRNFEGLVRRYPVRDSGALGEIEKMDWTQRKEVCVGCSEATSGGC